MKKSIQKNFFEVFIKFKRFSSIFRYGKEVRKKYFSFYFNPLNVSVALM